MIFTENLRTRRYLCGGVRKVPDYLLTEIVVSGFP